MAVLAFDMGGTSVKHAVWIENELKDASSFKTPPTWEAMKDSMKAVFDEKKDIVGIAISAPGSVDVETGVIAGISAIEYIHHFNIVAELQAMFGLPVSIENDANCAALAELWQGVAKGEDNLLFVVIGTGIGGSVIINGQLQKGKNLFGGEFGIMVLDGEESFSMLGTAVHMAERYSRAKGLEEDAHSGEEVFKLAKDGDEIAIKEVDKFYKYLALGLYNLQFTTDPSMIVLGGGVSQHKDLIPELNKRIKSRLKAAGLESLNVNLQACHYLADANLVGAVAAFNTQKGGIL